MFTHERKSECTHWTPTHHSTSKVHLKHGGGNRRWLRSLQQWRWNRHSKQPALPTIMKEPVTYQITILQSLTWWTKSVVVTHRSRKCLKVVKSLRACVTWGCSRKRDLRLTERLADSWQVRERPSRQSVWTSSKQNAWFLLLWQSCPYINIGMRMEVERASGKVEAPVLGTSEAHVHSLAFPYLLGHWWNLFFFHPVSCVTLMKSWSQRLTSICLDDKTLIIT